MEPTAILPAYMNELKMQNNIRVLIHNDYRIVYQIDCVAWMENKCSLAFARAYKVMWYGRMSVSRNCLKI